MANPAVSQTYDSTSAPESRKRLDTFGRRFVRFWEDQAGLDKPAEKLSALIREKAPQLAGQKGVDFLNGKYLGHPLHPILSDLPIGAFTFAMMFDVMSTGRKKPSRSATTLLAVGLASVPLTALAGAVDWQHTWGKTKRAGMGHIVLNSLGSTVLAGSLASRLTGKGPARTLNYLGNGILTLSAYLGGHLVYEARVGTKHEAEAEPPSKYTRVMADSDLKEQTLTRVEVDGYPLLLFKRFGRVYALGDVCPHLGCSLSEGSVEGDAVVCGCHGSKFDLTDGSVLQGPSAFPVRDFIARVHEGQVEVVAI